MIYQTIGKGCSNKHCCLLTFFCLVASVVFATSRTSIAISSQADFDNMSQTIVAAIRSGQTNIRVKLKSKSTFVAKENHILLEGIKAPDVTLTIEGNDAVLIPDGREYHNGDVYASAFSYNNSWMTGVTDIPFWTHYEYAEGLIDIVDIENKICRLKTVGMTYPKNMSDNAYLLIPEWCQISIYKIDRIDGEYLYFKAPNLQISYDGGYIVNDDYNYGRTKIRYKLCNVNEQDDILSVINGKVNLPSGIEYVREGKVNNYIIREFGIRKSL